MNSVSPYAAAYRHMVKVEEEQVQIAAANNMSTPRVAMFMKQGQDQRRYNEPRHDEVAVVFVGSDGAPPAGRDIVVYPKEEEPCMISYMSANCDPMVYPLLFPRGDLGWHSGMKHNEERQTASRNTVTLLQFYAYRLAWRHSFSPLFHAGKLFQQYIVDAYVRTEASRLDFIRRNQSNLRVDLYQGLMDHIQSQAEDRQLQPGKVVILPSSFQGSPRAMQQNFQDAMSVVAKYGKPDLFLTFTCNPKCKDISDALPTGQRPEHRPDIVARVFKLHLDELIHDITKRHILGIPIAHVRVIEFQKRGLPHCHMLIILNEDSKLRNADDIDSLITAEIPVRATEPELYEAVKTAMVHGPCGVLNPNSVCMADGSCTKDYPKDFQNKTVLANDGFPHYRRRDNGRTIQVGTKEVDNRWIVPYNPYLMKKYQAHINLEACTSVKSVKYLFKYVYKGHDCANIQVTATDELSHDEVSTFLDARYVSAPEAFWRLSEFPLHEQSHTIIRLPVHLHEQQPVYFKQGKHEEALQRASRQETMLTAWFALNRKSSQPYTYNEIPHYFVFNYQLRQWKPRKRGGDNIIGRTYYVSPKQTERFCLRLLLLHVHGATSFEDLRTYDGCLMETFKEACVARHLLADDKEWDNTLQEASAFQMPNQLRSLFATICSHCEPIDPLSLWLTHKDAMIEDYVNVQHMSLNDAEQLALADIEASLIECGIMCVDLGLPKLDTMPFDTDNVMEMDTPMPSLDILNSEQMALVETMINTLKQLQSGCEPESRAFFLDGPGGSGKTTVYNILMSYFRSHDITFASGAWTGIAATLLTGGRTIHSLFKLPVPIVETSTCNVTPTSSHAEYLRSVTVFILDEASMIPVHALSAIDTMLRDITAVDAPFGGKVFLLGGDFRQVLPVVPRSNRTAIVENCLKRSPLWSQFKVYKLTKNMRALEQEKAFSQWLLQLGNGTLSEVPESNFPHTMQVPDECNIVDRDIVSEIFTDLTNTSITSKSVILSPTNQHTLKLNDQVIQKLPGESKTFLSADKAHNGSDDAADIYPTEFLNSLTPSGMPPHNLTLKKGGIIMLLRNLCVGKGLCNGTRLVIKHLHNHVIDAEILSGSNAGYRTLIPSIKLAPSDAQLPFTLERRQFPIRLAYSMTINKAQGQTFDKVGIFLPSPVFSHGQLYVAFSRARSFSDVFVHVLESSGQGKVRGLTYTQNIVYKEVL